MRQPPCWTGPHFGAGLFFNTSTPDDATSADATTSAGAGRHRRGIHRNSDSSALPIRPGFAGSGVATNVVAYAASGGDIEMDQAVVTRERFYSSRPLRDLAYRTLRPHAVRIEVYHICG